MRSPHYSELEALPLSKLISLKELAIQEFENNGAEAGLRAMSCAMDYALAAVKDAKQRTPEARQERAAVSALFPRRGNVIALPNRKEAPARLTPPGA